MGWQIKTKGGALYGPIDSDTLRKWIHEKRILPEDEVWDESKGKWIDIQSVPPLRAFFKEDKKTVHSASPETPEVEKKHIIFTPEEKQTTSALEETILDDKSVLTFQLISDAWRAMLAKGIWSIIGAILLMAIVAMAGAVIIGRIPGYFPVKIISGFITEFIWFVIVAALTLGWAAYSLKIARRETVNVGSIFEGFKGQYIWRALGAYLLMALLTAVASLVSLGIWGFYLTLAYIFVYFFIFDENKGPWEAMKASYDITKGYKWRIMSVQIVCMLLGILFLGIGLFVTIPLMNIALASLYYRIRTGRISEKHLRTSFGEYLIVLIPFIIILFVAMLILTNVFKEKMPLLLPQIQQIWDNLPKKI